MTQNNHFWLTGLFLCLSFSIFSQVTFEATYRTTNLHRVNWVYGGEKYWYSDDSLKEIKIFSAQHQEISKIPYPSVSNAQVQLLQGDYGVTQTTINPDNLLEMVWLIKDTVLKQDKLQIRNELDSVLFMYDMPFESVYFSEIEGLPTKMFITTYVNGFSKYFAKVYALPSIQLENTYSSARYLHRKKFGYAGEKYFYKDADSKLMRLYNSNHSFWRNVKLAWVQGISLNYDDLYTDADDKFFLKTL
jgi:hypothetical protein